MTGNDVCIVFPAVGGEPTLAAVKALREDWRGPGILRMVGLDIDRWKGGLMPLDAFRLAPLRSDPDYPHFLARVCEEFAAQVLWPNPVEEQAVVWRHESAIVRSGVRLLMPPRKAVELFADKADTYAFAETLGLAVPARRPVRTLDDVEKAADSLGYPAKPVVFRRTQGRGGVGLRIVRDDHLLVAELFEGFGGSLGMTLDALRYVLSQSDEWPPCLLTEYLPGREYDVDCLCDETGFVHGVVRQNAHIYGGTSMLARVVRRPDLVDMARCLTAALGWRHICSVSFKEREDGCPVLMEVNPRMPSSINLTRAAGFNMPLAALLSVLGRSALKPGPLRTGMSIARFLAETITAPDEFDPGRADESE